MIKKIKRVVMLFVMGVSLLPVGIFAAGEPQFNSGEAQNAASNILTPMIDFGLWIIPSVATVSIIVAGVIWLCKDEDEKENKPFTKTLKRILIVAVAIESVQVILRIFGIA